MDKPRFRRSLDLAVRNRLASFSPLWPWPTLLLAFGAFYRIALVLLCPQHLVWHEETWSTSTVRGLLNGEIKLWELAPYTPWNWSSIVEVLWGVPIVYVLGTSVAAWKIVSISSFLLTAFLFWAVIRRFAGERAALWGTALLVIGPPSLTQWSLMTTHGRVFAWAGPLACLLMIAPIFDDFRQDKEQTISRRRLFTIGAGLGLAVWFHWDNVVPCTLLFLLLVAFQFRRKRDHPNQHFVVGISTLFLGLAVALAPLAFYLLRIDHPIGVYNRSFVVHPRFLEKLQEIPKGLAYSFDFQGFGPIATHHLGMGLLACFIIVVLALAWSTRSVGLPLISQFGAVFLILELALFPCLVATYEAWHTRFFRPYYPILIAAGACAGATLMSRGGHSRHFASVVLLLAVGIEVLGCVRLFGRTDWGKSFDLTYRYLPQHLGKTVSPSISPSQGPRAHFTNCLRDEVAHASQSPDQQGLSETIDEIVAHLSDNDRSRVLSVMGVEYAKRHRTRKRSIEEQLIALSSLLSPSSGQAFFRGFGWELEKAWPWIDDPSGTLMRLRASLTKAEADSLMRGYLESSSLGSKVPWSELTEHEISHWFRRQFILDKSSTKNLLTTPH